MKSFHSKAVSDRICSRTPTYCSREQFVQLWHLVLHKIVHALFSQTSSWTSSFERSRTRTNLRLLTTKTRDHLQISVSIHKCSNSNLVSLQTPGLKLVLFSTKLILMENSRKLILTSVNLFFKKSFLWFFNSLHTMSLSRLIRTRKRKIQIRFETSSFEIFFYFWHKNFNEQFCSKLRILSLNAHQANVHQLHVFL